MGNVRVAPSKMNGLGVFVARDIKNGGRVLAIDDSRVVTPEKPLRADRGELERHCDYLAQGKSVLMQPPERYINHSCDPNVFVKTVGGVRYVCARRDVSAGEEIAYDYCIDSSGDTVWHCNCGAQRCRRTIHRTSFTCLWMCRWSTCRC